VSAHDRISRQLSAYLDDELTSADAEEVRQHLSECEPCQAELAGLRAMQHLLGRLAEPEPPPGFLADLQARAARAHPRARPWWPFAWWPRPALAAAAVVLAVVLVAVPVLRGHRDRLRAAEIGPDLFVRAAVQSAAEDPFMDRAYIGLVVSDSNLRLAGEDPRGAGR
jgi:anti-sigma factor RsiW